MAAIWGFLACFAVVTPGVAQGTFSERECLRKCQNISPQSECGVAKAVPPHSKPGPKPDKYLEETWRVTTSGDSGTYYSSETAEDLARSGARNNAYDLCREDGGIRKRLINGGMMRCETAPDEEKKCWVEQVTWECKKDVRNPAYDRWRQNKRAYEDSVERQESIDSKHRECVERVEDKIRQCKRDCEQKAEAAAKRQKEESQKEKRDEDRRCQIKSLTPQQVDTERFQCPDCRTVTIRVSRNQYGQGLYNGEKDLDRAIRQACGMAVPPREASNDREDRREDEREEQEKRTENQDESEEEEKPGSDAAATAAKTATGRTSTGGGSDKDDGESDGGGTGAALGGVGTAGTSVGGLAAQDEQKEPPRRIQEAKEEFREGANQWIPWVTSLSLVATGGMILWLLDSINDGKSHEAGDYESPSDIPGASPLFGPDGIDSVWSRLAWRFETGYNTYGYEGYLIDGVPGPGVPISTEFSGMYTGMALRYGFFRGAVGYLGLFGSLLEGREADLRARYEPEEGDELVYSESLAMHGIAWSLGLQAFQGLLQPYAEYRRVDMMPLHRAGTVAGGIHEGTLYIPAAGALVLGNTFDFSGVFASDGPLRRSLIVDASWGIGLHGPLDGGLRLTLGYTVSWF